MRCIGLFGTCDKSPWRDDFIKKYVELGIPYFNPVVENWHPGCIPEEAKHLAQDEIILFPILGWSYGEGSLAELGFGPLRAMRQNMQRSFVVLIETEFHERLTDPARRDASLRARKLLLGHLKEVDAPNIYLVKDLDHMLAMSVDLFNIHSKMSDLRAQCA